MGGPMPIAPRNLAALGWLRQLAVPLIWLLTRPAWASGFALFSALIAAGYGLYASNLAERERMLNSVGQIVSELRSNRANPDFDNSLSRMVLAARLDRVIGAYPEHFSAADLLHLGSITISQEGNPYALQWYALAHRKAESDGDRPIIRVVAAWYLAAVEFEAGANEQGERHLWQAVRLADGLPVYRRRTILLQLALSRANSHMMAGEAERCSQILERVNRIIAADGRWLDAAPLRSGAMQLNNCQPPLVQLQTVPPPSETR